MFRPASLRIPLGVGGQGRVAKFLDSVRTDLASGIFDARGGVDSSGASGSDGVLHVSGMQPPGDKHGDSREGAVVEFQRIPIPGLSRARVPSIDDENGRATNRRG